MNDNDEKKKLIESMKKLSYHISNNLKQQQQIFSSLSANQIKKIMTNLYDQNEYLRRISALLLCQLFYDNNQIKGKLIDMLKLSPRNGRVCINGIPPSLHKYPLLITRCVQLMKQDCIVGEQTKMCWIINVDRKNMKIQFLDFKKYSSFTFIDPAKTIFGFTYFEKQAQRSSIIFNKNKKQLKLNQTSQQIKPDNFSIKYYLEQRTKSIQSRQNITNSLQKLNQTFNGIRSVSKTPKQAVNRTLRNQQLPENKQAKSRYFKFDTTLFSAKVRQVKEKQAENEKNKQRQIKIKRQSLTPRTKFETKIKQSNRNELNRSTNEYSFDKTPQTDRMRQKSAKWRD